VALIVCHATAALGQEPEPPDTLAGARRDSLATAPLDSIGLLPSVLRVPVRDTAVADSVPPPRPGWAFAQSVLLPGWGQARYDSHFRGAVYFAGWAGSWFMNIKNFAKLDEAREMRAMRRSSVLDSLAAVAETDTMIAALLTDATRAEELNALILEDSIADDLRKLVNAREQQREDWIAWTIFWTLASGIDAFVTAHLADFPDVIQVEAVPGGGAALRLEVPLPGRRR